MIWARGASRQAEGIVTLATDEHGQTAGIALLDEDGIAAQIINRDVAVQVALRILELAHIDRDSPSYHDRAIRAEAELHEMTTRAGRFHDAAFNRERTLKRRLDVDRRLEAVEN